MRSVEAGDDANLLVARRGRVTSSPPQFGQTPACASLQAAQNVHSKEQIRASPESGGKSLSQHSQPGLICSMVQSL
jgi:hypothetical protein